jgi:hypothetical protein
MIKRQITHVGLQTRNEANQVVDGVQYIPAQFVDVEWKGEYFVGDRYYKALDGTYLSNFRGYRLKLNFRSNAFLPVPLGTAAATGTFTVNSNPQTSEGFYNFGVGSVNTPTFSIQASDTVEQARDKILNEITNVTDITDDWIVLPTSTDGISFEYRSLGTVGNGFTIGLNGVAGDDSLDTTGSTSSGGTNATGNDALYIFYEYLLRLRNPFNKLIAWVKYSDNSEQQYEVVPEDTGLLSVFENQVRRGTAEVDIQLSGKGIEREGIPSAWQIS